MDQIKKAIADNGCSFVLGDEETFRKLYDDKYKTPAPGSVTKVTDVKYGDKDRNFLDVFYPTEGPSGKPVLMYVHGGGFFSGDKAWSDKVYANVGNYFAERGVVTVIPNHRLVPNARHPDGADDVQAARDWIFANIADAKFGGGNPNFVVIWGHSSGGAHVMSNLCAPGTTTIHPPVAGLALLSVPWWFDMRKPMRNSIINQYYGTNVEEKWEPDSPLGLFKRIPDNSPLLNPASIPILLGTVKYEVEEACDGMIKFMNEYRSRSTPKGALPLISVIDDHNHLSNVLSIGSEDEVQGKALLDYIHSCVAKAQVRAKL
ncbi:alpha/beta-hydrolase [Meredithblackwellia eburnea MCA 4105]